MSSRINKAVAFDWLNVRAAVPDSDARRAAEARQAMLTKPPGALGRLEDIAVRLASLQGTARPGIERVQITVFAGDHGVAAEGVSAFPQSVTAEMVKNFAHGGAAINAAARMIGAELEVVNLGTVRDTAHLKEVKNYTLGPGTSNFTVEAAMTEYQLSCSLAAGRHAAERARLGCAQLFIGGEMGIANTTAATALACALLEEKPERLAGPGTGLDHSGVAHKVRVIQRALDVHAGHLDSPLESLGRVGGFEIAALTGAYLACAVMGLPVLVDGFITSVAALAAARLCPTAEAWFLFAHVSAEPGHRIVLEALDARPLLDLGMRLGEGSGAAAAVPLLRLACALHNDMATFAEASVSEQAT
ncbi:MAG: nicotinate-nucleotide--dimethylbenzimidazole phosphoribosyltransferase [Methylococcales bacterium]